MKAFFLILALPAVLCTQTLSAREMRPSLKDSLQKASNLMFEQGISEFITVDAVVDGVLELNKPYHFIYNDQQLRFKGEKLSKKQRRKYTEKFQTCLRNAGMPENTSISIQSDAISLDAIFKTTASFSTDKNENKSTKTTSATWITSAAPYKSLPQSDSTSHLGDLLVLNMINDKLVDTSKKIEIKYTPGSVLVNGEKLSDPHNAKYTAMIEEVNRQSNSKPDMITFSFSAHANKLRYPHPGLATKDK